MSSNARAAAAAAAATKRAASTAPLATPSRKNPNIKIALGEITDKNLGQVKLLNAKLFPVVYEDKFYANLLLALPDDLCRLAFESDVLVGNVCCRLEPAVAAADAAPGAACSRCYIMTLGVLVPYRRLGVGARLLEFVLEQLQTKHPLVRSVYLHVQTVNTDGVAFYKRFGFAVVATLPHHYARIENPDCYVLEKQLEPPPPPRT